MEKVLKVMKVSLNFLTFALQLTPSSDNQLLIHDGYG